MTEKINTCQVCGQGQLLVVKDSVHSIFLVMCDDCESQWDSPQSIINGRNALKRDLYPRVQDATFEEIKNKGWDKYFVNLPQVTQ